MERLGGQASAYFQMACLVALFQEVQDGGRPFPNV